MKSRPWYRTVPEEVALVAGLGWIPFLPRKMIVWLSRRIGDLAWLFSKKLRRVAEANVALVFGETADPAARSSMLRNCYRHFALMVLDLLWFSRKAESRLAAWVHWGPDTAPVFEPGAQLMLTAHYGNWETLGQAYAARGQPIFSVAAPLKNPRVDARFLALRQQTGQKIIPQKGAARKLLQGLKQGRKLAVLLDQNTHPEAGGVFVPFFGLPVPVSSAPAALALKTGAAVIPVVCVPDAAGHYTVRVFPQLVADPAAADPVRALTEQMTQAIESVIRETPEYWCWMYKRWKYIPEGESAARYPHYARRISG